MFSAYVQPRWGRPYRTVVAGLNMLPGQSCSNSGRSGKGQGTSALAAHTWGECPAEQAGSELPPSLCGLTFGHNQVHWDIVGLRMDRDDP